MPKSVATIKHPVQENNSNFPVAGSAEEIQMFSQLQEQFRRQFEEIFPDKLAPRTVLVIPSFSMDEEILSKVTGINHYEERLLCLLMLLRMPRTHVIFATSVTIDPVITDYYIHMLPGVTGYHALQRLTLISCYDASFVPLTKKILERPRIIQRIRELIPRNHEAHMACFNVTPLERTLAVRLQIPIFGCDPDLYALGTKSSSRKIFRQCELNLPRGFEDLHSKEDIIHALFQLKKQLPQLRKAVVKINDGFSGDGNAVFSYAGIEESNDAQQWLTEHFEKKLKIVAGDFSLKDFLNKYNKLGGIAEEFIEGDIKESPSVQCRIIPTGVSEVLSTHDQELGGESGQVYIGARFPASDEYAVAIGSMGKKIADVLKDEGVLGRFAIDFISVKENNSWKHYPIEINLRKGGTTHPFLMLQFLTDGIYDAETGIYKTSKGELTRYYFTSDNLSNKKYVGLTPHDLIDIAMMNDLNYDGTSQEGVMFHLIGALSQYGKIGVVCIGSTPQRAKEFYDRIVEVLDKECRLVMK